MPTSDQLLQDRQLQKARKFVVRVPSIVDPLIGVPVLLRLPMGTREYQVLPPMWAEKVACSPVGILKKPARFIFISSAPGKADRITSPRWAPQKASPLTAGFNSIHREIVPEPGMT